MQHSVGPKNMKYMKSMFFRRISQVSATFYLKRKQFPENTKMLFGPQNFEKCQISDLSV